jgi:hypothetical protein
MKIVAAIDQVGNGHHDAFDDKFLTVLSKFLILCIPDRTNIHSKQRTAVTSVAVCGERMIGVCFT